MNNICPRPAFPGRPYATTFRKGELMSDESLLNRRRFMGHLAGAAGLMTILRVAQPNLQAAPSLPRKPGEVEGLLAELEKRGRQFLSVPREDGEFLNLMIKATRSKRVLEVGTSHGYSAIWISLGLEETGGHLTTIEILPERVELARQNLKQAGLDQRVEFLQGNAHEVVPTLKGPFDFVFLDADKGREHDYFNYLFPDKLPPGGIIAVHNAIHFRAQMKTYLDMIKKHPQFDSVMLSLTMDDGFSISYRRRSAT
jgi:predicted O-methyltransferase YrrM